MARPRQPKRLTLIRDQARSRAYVFNPRKHPWTILRARTGRRLAWKLVVSFGPDHPRVFETFQEARAWLQREVPAADWSRLGDRAHLPQYAPAAAPHMAAAGAGPGPVGGPPVAPAAVEPNRFSLYSEYGCPDDRWIATLEPGDRVRLPQAALSCRYSGNCCAYDEDWGNGWAASGERNCEDLPAAMTYAEHL